METIHFPLITPLPEHNPQSIPSLLKLSLNWEPSITLLTSINVGRLHNLINADIIEDLPADVGATIIPVLVFIDENNNEIGRLIGEKTKKEIIKEIERLSWKN